MSSRSEDTYLFIDGEYLRRRNNEAMLSVFLCDGDIDFGEIKREAGAKRAFLYDCIDDEQKEGETEAEFAKRVSNQES